VKHGTSEHKERNLDQPESWRATNEERPKVKRGGEKKQLSTGKHYGNITKPQTRKGHKKPPYNTHERRVESEP